MKKLLLVLCATVVLAGCSKKENKAASSPSTPLTPETATAADIMGSWQLTVDTLYQPDPSGKIDTVPGDETVNGEVLNFGANNLGVTTTTIDANFTSQFGWSLSKGVLTISSTGTEPTVNKILTISKTRILLKEIRTYGSYDWVMVKP